MVLCGTKNGSSMASLWRTFWSNFIFKSVIDPSLFLGLIVLGLCMEVCFRHWKKKIKK